MSKLFGWLTLADYENAKEEAAQKIATRYSRGNTSLKNGWFMDAKTLKRRSLKADRAIAKVQQRITASEKKTRVPVTTE